jgi:hypothetical protein
MTTILTFIDIEPVRETGIGYSAGVVVTLADLHPGQHQKQGQGNGQAGCRCLLGQPQG